MKRSLLTLLFVVLIKSALIAQENLNTSRLGTWPYGFALTAEVFDDYAIASVGRTLQVFDFSDPEEMVLSSEVFIDDVVYGLKVRDNLVYAGGYFGGFYIIDVSDPGQIELVSSIDIGLNFSSIDLNGNYAYLISSDNGIYTVNIEDPTSPFYVGEYEISESIKDICVYNNFAFVSIVDQGIVVFDITDPINLFEVSSYDTTGYFVDILTAGDSLYALNPHCGLMLFDISDPTDFELISNTNHIFNGLSLSKWNNIVAVSVSSHGVFLYDYTDPLNPVITASYQMPSSNKKVILKDSIAFHLTSFALFMLDVSDPQVINKLDEVEIPGISQYASYWNDHLYTHGEKNPLRVFDVSDPANPLVVFEETGTQRYFETYAKDDLLFLADYFYLKIFDVSTPASPVLLDTIQGTTTIIKVLKNDNLLFVADYDSLQIFDISDIHGAERKTIIPYDHLDDMLVDGNYLYCLNFSYLNIFDISDPDNIVMVCSRHFTSGNSLALRDSMLYVVSKVYPGMYENSLHMVNVADPTNAIKVKSMEYQRDFRKGVGSDGYLYIYEGGNGVLIYDLTIPENPELCGFYRVDWVTVEFDVVDGIGYFPVITGIDIMHNDLIMSADHIFIPATERLVLYPNPASDHVSFSLGETITSGKITYELISINGAVVKTGTVNADNTPISLNELPSGMYIIRVVFNEKTSKSALFNKL